MTSFITFRKQSRWPACIKTILSTSFIMLGKLFKAMCYYGPCCGQDNVVNTFANKNSLLDLEQSTRTSGGTELAASLNFLDRKNVGYIIYIICLSMMFYYIQ